MEKIENSNHKNQGGVLKQCDKDIDDVRQCHAQGLRQDDERDRAPIGQTERLRRLKLRGRDGQKSAAHHFRHIGRSEQRDADEGP